MLQGKRSWLERPSTLFDLLVKADARDQGRRALHYYELAMRLAHASAAVDLVPSPDEVAAIDSYRSVLLAAFDAAGVARPGAASRAPVKQAATTGAAPAATAAPPPPDLPADAPDRGAARRARRPCRTRDREVRRAPAHEPAAHPAACARTASCRRSRRATIWSSRATPAPARPRWLACSARSCAASASSPKVTSWRPTDRTSSPATSARRRRRRGRCSSRRSAAPC